MSLWSWLTGSQPSAATPPPPPPPAAEPPALSVDRAKQAGNIVDGINSLAFPQPLLYAALGGYASNTGVPVTPYTALQSAAVYGCCKCISEDIAGLDLQVRRRLPGGGWVTADDHPLNRLFRRPNRWQSKFQFWSYVLFAYCLRGNSFVVIMRDRYGNATELIPVSPDRVTLRVLPNGSLWYIVNSRQVGYGVVVAAEDMVHMKNMSIDGYLGLSPIAAAQDTIGLALAAQQHGAVLFRQGGQIAGVLQHPGKIGKEATDNIAESWRDTHSGVQNAHKVAILEEGMTFEKIQMTNEDAQFLATRQFQVIDICARIYRVPPHKVGELGRATFGNIEQQQQQYIDDCLVSHTDQLEGLLDDGLLFDDERERYAHHWDYTSMLRGDQLRRYQAYQVGLLNGFLSRNEVRASENMNPVPGGDEYRVPLNTGVPQHPESIGQEIPSGGGEGEGGEGGGESEAIDA